MDKARDVACFHRGRCLSPAGHDPSKASEFQTGPEIKPIGLGNYYREKILGQRGTVPSTVLEGEKSSMNIKDQRSTYSLDVGKLPENDAELANWLAKELGGDTKPQLFQKYLTLYGKDFLIKGVKRLNKYQNKHIEAVKNHEPGAKLIENPGGYLNLILQSMVHAREQGH